MAKNVIPIKLTIDGKEVNATLRDTDKLVGGLREHTKTVGGGFAQWGTIVTGVNQGLQLATQMMNQAQKFIDVYQVQERAQAKVAQSVKQTGESAGFTADELFRVASGLQEITTFGDERILNDITAQMLTFTNITGDNFLRAQEAAMDLATLLDGDLKSASIQLGKALNDPVANLSALSRSGIQFSDDQEKVIKQLVKTNQLAEAQTSILDELNRQYGGQAKAMAELDTGKIDQAMNKIGDQMERVGEIAAKIAGPIFSQLASGAEVMLNQYFPVETQLQKVTNETIRQKQELDSLSGTLLLLKEKNSLNNEEQKIMLDTIQKLQKEYPNYLGQVNLAAMSYDDVKTALDSAKTSLDEYTTAQIKAAVLEEKRAEIVKLGSQIVDWEVAKLELAKERNMTLEEMNKMDQTELSKLTENNIKMSAFSEQAIANLRENKSILENDLAALEKIVNDLFAKVKAPGTGGSITNTSTTKYLVDNTEIEDAGKDPFKSFDKEMSDQLVVNINGQIQALNDLAAIKQTIADQDSLNVEMELAREEYRSSTLMDLRESLLKEDTKRADIYKKLMDAEDKLAFDQLNAEKKISDSKIALIKAEIAAKEQQTVSAVESGMAMYNANQSIAKQMANLIRNEIKAIISKAMATQIGNVIASIPFPFNLIAAPAAGFAVSALFDSIIPEFGMGGLPGLVTGNSHKSGGKTINVEGEEFIVNKVSTRKYLPELMQMNSGNYSPGADMSVLIGEIRALGNAIFNRPSVVQIDPFALNESKRLYDESLQDIGFRG